MLFLEDVFGEHACLWIGGLENGSGGYVWRVSLEDVFGGPSCLGAYLDAMFGECAWRVHWEGIFEKLVSRMCLKCEFGNDLHYMFIQLF